MSDEASKGRDETLKERRRTVRSLVSLFTTHLVSYYTLGRHHDM